MAATVYPGRDAAPAGEPVQSAEIPTPGALSDALAWVESGAWFACGPPPRARQGWKLYVPFTPVNAREVLDRLAPAMIAARVHFKYVKDLKTLRKLNAGMFGYSQVGKSLVIYLPRTDGALVELLKRLLARYRGECPAVPCARPFGDDLPLYYRYGSYRDRELTIGGTPRADERSDAHTAVPSGIRDTLAQYTTAVRADPEVDAFLRRYPAFEALEQQGKGGIFLALNLASETFQEVVLKVGYHRGQVQPDGRDGCSFLRRELAAYRTIAERGLAALVPRVIDTLDRPRSVIAVLEHIPGSSLLARKLAGTLTADHLERCWAMLDRFHARGIVLGDAKLANFLATDAGDLRAVDFEAAGALEEERAAMHTFVVTDLQPGDPRTTDRLHFLASILYPYQSGRYSWKDRHVQLLPWLNRTPDTDVTAWAVARLLAMVRDVEEHRAYDGGA
ncbi:MAG TPA: hypothetical protein VF006_28475 [Longimicrobium sp.]